MIEEKSLLRSKDESWVCDEVNNYKDTYDKEIYDKEAEQFDSGVTTRKTSVPRGDLVPKATMAQGAIIVSEKPDELWKRLVLIVEEKLDGNDSNIFFDKFIAIFDNFSEFGIQM